MYVADTARVATQIMQNLTGPVNIGSGNVYSIKEIVEMIAEIAGMEKQVVWDRDKPNGQDFRSYDLTKINSMNFKTRHSIKDGLIETWDWYCKNN